jgi:hypothetical protein
MADLSLQTDADTCRQRDNKQEVRGAEQSRAVQLNQKKPEVRSEVCNLCSVVTETFGVLYVVVRLKVL